MNTNTTKSKRNIDLRTYTMIFVLIILWVAFTALTSNGFSDLEGSFITSRNLSNLTRQMAVVGIMSVGMVLVIVTAGIDLSVGSLMGFCGCVTASLMRYNQFPIIPSILVGLAIGAAVGYVQGLMIAKTGVPPFIVTLAGQLVFRGAIIGLTHGTTVSPLPEDFLLIGQSYLPLIAGYGIAAIAVVVMLIFALQNRRQRIAYNLEVKSVWRTLLSWAVLSAIIIAAVVILSLYKGVPIPVIIMMALVLIFKFIAESTVFGRRVYAIGGNMEAAKYSGIKIGKTIVVVYLLNGLLAAFAGVVLTSRLNAGMVSAGEGYELDAIAACVIGGTSMSGGVGKVTGAILGALIIATITNGMSMMNLESFWQYIVKGLILVAAVWFDISSKNRANKIKQV